MHVLTLYDIALYIFFFFFKQKTAYEIGLGIPAEPLFRSERPVKAAELFAFTLRVRAGNTDVLTDAEENVRQKLRAEGVMLCLKVKNVLALALVVRSRCEVDRKSVV